MHTELRSAHPGLSSVYPQFNVAANKTNFCTMGAVSDLVNIGDTSRLKAWFLAIAIAILGVTILELVGAINVNDSRIPYRNSVLFWPRYIVGGIMFGIGMTLASGCGNKILIRIGGGNLKSIFVLFLPNPLSIYFQLLKKVKCEGLRIEKVHS